MTSNVEGARFRLHPVVKGAMLGLAWGIAMRLWMRFISTNPEFTWAGTGYILGATTLAGSMLGVGWARRAKAKGNLWRLTGLSMLPLGMAAGGVMIPSVLLGALAMGRKNWHPAIRSLLLAIAVGFQVFAFTAGAGDGIRSGKIFTAMTAYAVFISLEALAFTIPFLPSRTAVPVSGTREPLLANDAG